MARTFREDLEDIQEDLENLNLKSAELLSIAEDQRLAVLDQTDAIRDQTETINSAIREQTAMLDFRLGEMNWQLSLQTQALFSIDHTLKTPTETLANEWRARAEELRRRGELKMSERLFLRCLEPENNPLDYRTYIGLAKTYELLNNPEKALEYYANSLRHAPRTSGRDWRSYSYLLMGLVYKSLSEHQQCYESSKKAIEYSPAYHVAYYHHARNSAAVGDKKSSFSSLWRAAAASPQFLTSALIDRHFEPWRREVVNFLAERVSSVELPAPKYRQAWFELAKYCGAFEQLDDSIRLLEKLALCDESYVRLALASKQFINLRQKIAVRTAQVVLDLDASKYHKTWFELSKHCASAGNDDLSCRLLEKSILQSPSFHISAENELSAFAPIESKIQSLLQRLIAEAKGRANKSIVDSEKSLKSAQDEVEHAELAMRKARNKDQLKSREAFDKAVSNLRVARQRCASSHYEELLGIPSIAKEAGILVASAMNYARDEKHYYDILKNKKIDTAMGKAIGMMGKAIIYAVVCGIGGCMSGLVFGGKRAGFEWILIPAFIALFVGFVVAINTYQTIRGAQSVQRN